MTVYVSMAASVGGGWLSTIKLRGVATGISVNEASEKQRRRKGENLKQGEPSE